MYVHEITLTFDGGGGCVESFQNKRCDILHTRAVLSYLQYKNHDINCLRIEREGAI